jgi:EAL domain-containing protein (putative c-di-GMP-specific phosphodiesterase class I)/CheY-like chemotaxis protein
VCQKSLQRLLREPGSKAQMTRLNPPEALEAALRDAIARDELRLSYQPQVSLGSGEIVAVEALLRWAHPVHGGTSPARFVPVAEEAGLIDAIGEWVIRHACRTAAGWQRRGLPPVRMMVNVSAHQLRDPYFAFRVEEILAQAGLDPRRFGIELTETSLLQDVGHIVAQLSRLRARGVHVVLDDFGTGASSLGCLARLPLDAVKIDRSLIPAVTADRDALALMRAIVAMAHCLGLKAVAEGVESEAQLEVLAANRCDAFQGYHFSAPLSATQVGDMLSAGRRMPVLARRRQAHVRSIVVVDDERWVGERLQKHLPLRFGDTIRVETYTDPNAAMQRLQTAPVDVVVCDLQMPDVDGIALMQLAREVQPSALRMMLLGPKDLARVIDDERQVDVFRYISKPWTGEALLAHFDAALDEVDRRRAAQVLEEGGRTSRDAANDVVMELLALERGDPGITAVPRGPMDEVMLPSQLMTLPGDLWVERRAVGS